MISVLIPVYATDEVHIQYLDECLSSVKDQSDDVVVWDDGSPIDIRTLAQHHGAHIKYHKGAHKGKSYARNSAVALARNSLILPLDADDWMADGALEKMRQIWEGNGGKPVYSDLYIVHPNDAQEIRSLPDFDCDQVVQKCLAAVSVLHSKSQWASVGGWSEAFNLYEDWLYNAKLMLKYCGQKIGQPLLYYRQHSLQSTAVFSEGKKHDAWVGVRFEIDGFINGGSEMPCCGKRRQTAGNRIATLRAQNTTAARSPTMMTQSVQAVDLSTTVDSVAALGDPGAGKVWALYVGGRGMGPHDRRGMASRKKYQRLKYGDRAIVSANDAISKAAFETGSRNCGFIILEQQVSAPDVRPLGEPPKVSPVIAKRPVSVVRTPVDDADIQAHIQTAKSMSLRELQKWLSAVELSLGQVQALLNAERAGANRIGAVKMLNKIINSITD